MFRSKVPLRKRNKEEGEKPFWISFSDLMTALMVLFLLVMSVALLAITKNVPKIEKQKIEREEKIKSFEDDLDKVINKFNIANPELRAQIKRRDNAIDLGTIATFDERSNVLTQNQTIKLRNFVKELIPLINQRKNSEILKNIQVVGFTNKNGKYLYNLNLSLQRSHRLVCVLLQDQQVDEKLFNLSELNLIKDYFLVSGYAFNDSTGSAENDRRIILRMNYIPIGEDKSTTASSVTNFGDCYL